MNLKAVLLNRTYIRIVVIGLITYAIGSALILPNLNPVTRSSALTNAIAFNGWQEIGMWRVGIHQYYSDRGEWPTDISELQPRVLTGNLLTVTSPQPFRLIATYIDDEKLTSDLAGKRIVLDWNPETAQFACSPGEPPVPDKALLPSCQRFGSEEPVGDSTVSELRFIVIVCVLVVLIVAVLLLLRHPLLGPVQSRPDNLLRLPISQLPKLDRLLRLMGRKKNTLLAAGVSASNWQRALDLAGGDGAQRVAALALRVGAKCQASSGWTLPGRVYEWRFSAELPVSLDRCLVYVPEDGLVDDMLVQHLRGMQTGLDVMLVLPVADAEALSDFCQDAANLYVAVDEASQSEWLLAAKPLDVLLRLLAAQLKVTRISPYQTRGGVVRAGSFFGRAQLLARVLNREPANYLVVGGRQLGKSSLLKAVQRRLVEHPQIACHYISLRDHRLAPRLALQFGLPAETALEQVLAHIVASHVGKRVFLLIDEADLFFRDESNNGYRQLSTLRALSEEGRCWFMLAGFWDLYATAVLDYQSPLRNFGEVLTIGGLEPDACRELASVPLKHLRLGFASNALVDEVVEASGQRANLVAIICQECLEALQPGERAIGRHHLQQALSSQAVQDALAGWGRLSHDEDACRLDRIVVYHTACHGQTSLQELVALFANQRQRVDMDALNRALQRLVLAFVLRREQSLYRFAMPLFALQFEPAELELFLRQELQAGKPPTRAVDGGSSG
ncbi:hypothetical protein ACVW0Y_003709 [Pseudomonas sp. TE3786]